MREGPGRPRRGRVAFVDFGNGAVYFLTDTDDGDVRKVKSLMELPEDVSVVVVDSYPRTASREIFRLIERGKTLLYLTRLDLIARYRQQLSLEKSNENDTRALKTIFEQHPEHFARLTREEVILRTLTELRLLFNEEKKEAKAALKGIDLLIPEVKELLNDRRRAVERLDRLILRYAEEWEPYRFVAERLGIGGFSLAYLLTHSRGLWYKPRDKLRTEFELYDRGYGKRKRKSQVLILLADSLVKNRHPRYRLIYERYYQRFSKTHSKRAAHWKATLRVARKMLWDIAKCLRENWLGRG